MSQHRFRCVHQGQPIEVTIGFDRPLGYVFMTIITDDEEQILYSNLDDDVAGIHCRDVNYFRRLLQRMNITVPECMFNETLRDQIGHVGNRNVEHQ